MCDIGLGSHKASAEFNNVNKNEDETKCLNMTQDKTQHKELKIKRCID